MAPRIHAAVTALGLLLAVPAVAQESDFDKVTIRAEPLAPGVAVLFGSGGNIGVSHGSDGTVLIDDQFAPLTPRILAAVQALGAKPVKFVINTHWHFDHTGGNENLGQAGAVIVAQDNVRSRLAAGQVNAFLKRTLPPAPAVALPVVTFAQSVTLHLNGEEIRVIHVPRAHTDGDALVKFVKANVLHTGDVFIRTGFPFLDLESGGSARGLLAAQDVILALTDERTRIIPGHGQVSSRADVIAFREVIATVIGRVEAGMKAGKSLATIQAEKPAAQWDSAPNAFITGDRFVAAIHASLSAPDAAPLHKHVGGGHRH